MLWKKYNLIKIFFEFWFSFETIYEGKLINVDFLSYIKLTIKKYI